MVNGILLLPLIGPGLGNCNQPLAQGPYVIVAVQFSCGVLTLFKVSCTGGILGPPKLAGVILGPPKLSGLVVYED
jgi:hypothetical protein